MEITTLRTGSSPRSSWNGESRKNLLIGCGGAEAINVSHFIGALYGMERMMGHTDTPVRQIFSKAFEDYCGDLNIVFILTVVGPAKEGEIADDHGLVTRGIFAGTGLECFEKAAELSFAVNFNMLERQPKKVVVYLDPEEYHSTWLGNKAIYRTRMAIADGGELIILAPGVERFGEDEAVDSSIRKHGYRSTSEVLAAVEDDDDLKSNLSAAAHLVHGSAENRFRITYAPGGLTKAEIESVGYEYADLTPLLQKYDSAKLVDGWNIVDGEEIFFIRNPALGLWAHASRFVDPKSPVVDVEMERGKIWHTALSHHALGKTDEALKSVQAFTKTLPVSEPWDHSAWYASEQLQYILSSGIQCINVMGTMGSGKSQIGKALADVLGFEFVDSDTFHSEEAQAKMANNITLTHEDRRPFLLGLRDFFAQASNKGRVSTSSALIDPYRAILAGQDFEILNHPELIPWDPAPFGVKLNFGLLEVWAKKPYEIALAELDLITKKLGKTEDVTVRPKYIFVTKEDPTLLKRQYELLESSPPRPYQAIEIDSYEFFRPEMNRYETAKMIEYLMGFIKG